MRITWQTDKPYACLAMGFKSRHIPSLVVRRESAQPCLLFEPKPGRARAVQGSPAKTPGPGGGWDGGVTV